MFQRAHRLSACFIAALMIALVRERGGFCANQEPAPEALHWSVVSGPVVGPDGKIYVLAAVGDVHPPEGPKQMDWTVVEPGRNYLCALRPDGTQKWRLALGDALLSNEATGLCAWRAGTLYVATTRPMLYSLDPSGAEKWKVLFGGNRIEWFDFGPDETIYLLRGNVLDALKADATQKWETASEAYPSGAPVVGPDGTVYLMAWNLLQAISPEGRRRWSLGLGEGPIHALRCPQLKGGNGWVIYAVGNDNLYALAPNGTQKWEFPFAGRLVGSLDFGPDGTIYFPANAANGHGRVYALRTDGTQKWKFDDPVTWEPTQHCSVRVGLGGIVYYVESGKLPENPWRGGRVYALGPDGTLRWQVPLGGGPVVRLAVLGVGADGTIYVADTILPGHVTWVRWETFMVGALYALTPGGHQKWRFSGKGVSYLAFGADGTIYVAQNYELGDPARRTGTLYALTPAGDQKWAFSPGIEAGPAAVVGPGP